MKPAREPAASTRPKPEASLKDAQDFFPFVTHPCCLSQEENRPCWSEIHFSLRNLPVRAFDSRAQAFSSPSPGSSMIVRRASLRPRQICCLLHPIEHTIKYYGTHLRVLQRPTRQAFREIATCLTRTASSRRAPNWSSDEAHRVNAILTQPKRRHVSTHRLNRVDSQMVPSHEGVSPAPNRQEKPSHTNIPQNQVSEGGREGTRLTT